jgi:hypothetical protein
MAETAFILIPRRKNNAMKFRQGKSACKSLRKSFSEEKARSWFRPAAAHTLSLEFKFLVAHIIGLGSPPPRVCSPLPRVTPHGMESSETWIIDCATACPLLMTDLAIDWKIDDAAAKAEVAVMRAAVYGKDKI